MNAPTERWTDLVLEQVKLCLETAGSSLARVPERDVYGTSVAMLSRDVLDTVLTPGDLILMMASKERASADRCGDPAMRQANARLRQVRVIRASGMVHRRGVRRVGMSSSAVLRERMPRLPGVVEKPRGALGASSER